MLKTRVLSSIIGLLILIGTITISKETLAAAVFILAIFGIYEFYSSMSNIGYKPIKSIGFILCTVILLVGFRDLTPVKHLLNMIKNIFPETIKTYEIVLFGFFILILALYIIPVFKFGKYNTTDISITMYGAFYIVFLFLFIVLIRELPYGAHFVWFVLLGAWGTDTFAYFGGKTLGRKKLAPMLSPHKTIAGSISGIIGSIAVMAVYGLVMGKYLGNISYYHYIIIGALCGIISQVGDLVASSTKRYTKIKDYGYIIPGHGGVLDRFDSVLFTAPVVYFYIILFVEGL